MTPKPNTESLFIGTSGKAYCYHCSNYEISLTTGLAPLKCPRCGSDYHALGVDPTERADWNRYVRRSTPDPLPMSASSADKTMRLDETTERLIEEHAARYRDFFWIHQVQGMAPPNHHELQDAEDCRHGTHVRLYKARAALRARIQQLQQEARSEGHQRGYKDGHSFAEAVALRDPADD